MVPIKPIIISISGGFVVRIHRNIMIVRRIQRLKADIKLGNQRLRFKAIMFCFSGRESGRCRRVIGVRDGLLDSMKY